MSQRIKSQTPYNSAKSQLTETSRETENMQYRLQYLNTVLTEQELLKQKAIRSSHANNMSHVNHLQSRQRTEDVKNREEYIRDQYKRSASAQRDEMLKSQQQSRQYYSEQMKNIGSQGRQDYIQLRQQQLSNQQQELAHNQRKYLRTKNQLEAGTEKRNQYQQQKSDDMTQMRMQTQINIQQNIADLNNRQDQMKEKERQILNNIERCKEETQQIYKGQK